MVKKHTREEYGDEAPTPKEFIMVILVVVLMITLAWIAYYKFGWFH